MNDEMRDMILNKCTTDQLRDKACSYGMVTLRTSGEQFIHEGITTADEVIRETILEA